MPLQGESHDRTLLIYARPCGHPGFCGRHIVFYVLDAEATRTRYPFVRAFFKGHFLLFQGLLGVTVWLNLLGCGVDGVSGLTPPARKLLERAEIVFGSERLLSDPFFSDRVREVWCSPIHESIKRLLAYRGREVCVLATGDPMYYGIGAALLRHFSIEEMRVIPASSAFSLAAARLGWPLQHVDCLSLCGRSPALVDPFIYPGARLLILGMTGPLLSDVAGRLYKRGFERSRLVILENMGGEAERVAEMTVERASRESISDLSLLAVSCIAGPRSLILSRAPGLPDDLFRHDGQLTKRDVRAATISALGPYPGALLWDVGAGCGSISIEWMRAARDARSIAIERNSERLGMIMENALALGAPDIQIRACEAPDGLEGLERPDAIFIGGSVSLEALFSACWRLLRPHGVLVANAATLEAVAALTARHRNHGGELLRIDIATSTSLRSYRVLKPRMSILSWRVRKEGS